MIALFIIAISFLVVFVAFRIAEVSAASRAEEAALEAYWKRRQEQPLEMFQYDSTPLMDDCAPLPDERHRGEVVPFQKKQPQSAA